MICGNYAECCRTYLDFEMSSSYQNVVCTVISIKVFPGRGTIYFGGPSATKLQEVNVRVWDNSLCDANYQKLRRRVIDTMMCAGEDEKDACQVLMGKLMNYWTILQMILMIG